MIMNEKERVKNLLSVGDFSENGGDFNNEIRLLIRYVIFEEGVTIQEEILERVIDVLEDKVPNISIWEWEELIESKIKEELKNQTYITEIKEVYITKDELETILSLKLAYQRKFLFTCIIYARYAQLAKEEEKERYFGSTVKRTKEILKSANLNDMEFRRQHLICKSLLDLGLLERAKSYGSLGLKVKCLHNEGEAVLWVNTFEDLGNYIEEKIKPLLKERKEEEKRLALEEKYNEKLAKVDKDGKSIYKKCEYCGKPFKPKSNRAIYCTACAKEKAKEKTKERMKKMRTK